MSFRFCYNHNRLEMPDRNPKPDSRTSSDKLKTYLTLALEQGHVSIENYFYG